MNKEQFHCSRIMPKKEMIAVQEQTWENSIGYEYPKRVLLKIVPIVIFLMI